MGGEEDAVEWGKSKPFLLLPNFVSSIGLQWKEGTERHKKLLYISMDNLLRSSHLIKHGNVIKRQFAFFPANDLCWVGENKEWF